MTQLEKYFLESNPFPESAYVKIDSGDPRTDGSIFVKDVFEDNEVESLAEKINRRTNLIYVSGIEDEKGVGKSALLVNQWKTINKAAKFPTAYIRCTGSSPVNRPPGFCMAIIGELHKNGWLWRAFQKHLLDYCKTTNDYRIDPASIISMFNFAKWPCDRVPLNLYTHISKPEIFGKKFASWITSQLAVNQKVAEHLASSYLTNPQDFLENLERDRRIDKIEAYQSVLRLLSKADLQPCFFFLDQWEDAVYPISPSKIGEFCSEMRRMVEAGGSLATVVVTLHQDSDVRLNITSCDQLLAIAKKDSLHVVDVSKLRRKDAAILLAVAYLKYFRIQGKEISSPTYPFDPRAIMYISFVTEGNIRYILQYLHQCLEFSLTQDNDLIDLEFIKNHHLETMGKELNENQYEEFLKGYQDGK